MQRRSFFQKTGLALLATAFSQTKSSATPMPETTTLKPARLSEGARIALIAPASPVSEEKIQKALDNLNALGYQVQEGAALRARHGYLAGTDAARLADLHQAFADPEIDAVWCVRGGYGITRLLPQINYELIRQHPKPLIGYSDVTALHLAIGKKTGLVSFHGPVAASDFPEDTLAHFRAALIEPQAPYRIDAPAPDAELPGPEFSPFTIQAGRASGPLTGGNLSLLAALAGTPFQPSFSGKIAFIEDVGEQPYRIDRMLTQLLQATDLRDAAGIALGVFADCGAKNPEFSLTLPETLQDRLGGLGIPVVYGLPFGHVAHQATFPYGVLAELDASERWLSLLEIGVS